MKRTMFLTLMLFAIGVPPAFAYIDPGSGSAIMSVIIGFFVAIGVLVKTFWYKIMNVILLAAGYNKYSDKPCSLWSLGNGRSILDWQMHAFETALPNGEVNIAVGYNYQKIITNHPYHIFRHVLDMENGCALHSFLVDKIYQLIEDCKKFGTLAFSHAARAGFVAVTLLKSLVKTGCLTQDRMLEFQASVPTTSIFTYSVN